MGNVNMEARQIHYRGGNKPMNVEDAIKEAGSGSGAIAAIAPEFNATSQYMAGDLVFYEGTLYRFEEDHNQGAWDSTEVMATTISENLVMFPGYGLRRTIHTYDVKLQQGGGLDIDENGALYTNVVHNYSTTEQPTGQKWIDGKDIYFRVVDIGLLPDRGSKTITLGLAIDTLVRIGGSVIAGAGGFLPLPFVSFDSNTSFSTWVNIDSNGDLVVTDNSTFGTAGYTGVCVIEYTKVTV